MKTMPQRMRQNVGALILVVLPALAILGYVWHLHTPPPGSRSLVVLHRNSLLPHRYVGTCTSCHSIRDTAPVPMNRANMHMFRLTDAQRALLAAGQEVRLPTAVQQAAMPAILHGDVLPHAYVGVCSNCHVVLDVRPSRAFMDEGMRRAREPFLGAGMGPTGFATPTASVIDPARAKWRDLFGWSSVLLFLLSGVYIVQRVLMRKNPSAYAGLFDLKRWLLVHEWSSVGLCVSALLHWYFSDRGNNFLHVSLVALIWLTGAGFVLRYRLTHRATRKNLRLLHTQRFVFLALVAFLVFGHLFVGVS